MRMDYENKALASSGRNMGIFRNIFILEKKINPREKWKYGYLRNPEGNPFLATGKSKWRPKRLC